MATNLILKRMGIDLPVIEKIASFTSARGLYEYIQDMKNETPQTKSFYIKTEYYKCDIAKIPSRPFEYCWKLKIHYYFDSHFTQECGYDEIYATQVLFT